jgi:uncharacterized protein YbjT (DUF2867 family)
MILVAGATGFVGNEICRSLAEQGKSVRALVRATSNPDRLEALRTSGVALYHGDVKAPETLGAACAGVETVISTVSSTLGGQPGDSIDAVDRQGNLNLIETARAAGARHFIFTSYPPAGMDFPLERAKREVESQIRESGMEYTIWQPVCFMEVWLSAALGFDLRNGKARMLGEGNGRTSWISARDVARFAVLSVDHAEARNRVIPLGGPEPLSQREVVRIAEQETGRRFELEFVPEAALRAQKEAASDPLQQSMAALLLLAVRGQQVDMRPVLETFPVRVTSVRDYFRAALETQATGA